MTIPIINREAMQPTTIPAIAFDEMGLGASAESTLVLLAIAVDPEAVIPPANDDIAVVDEGTTKEEPEGPKASAAA